MRFFVEVDVVDTNAAAAWLGRVKESLEAVPPGVTVIIRVEGQPPKEDGPQGDFVGFDDLLRFFRPQLPQRRVHYNARMVLYYLVYTLHDRLVVKCTKCEQRYGECRCSDLGRYHEGEWSYRTFTADDTYAQYRWVVGRAGLRSLNPFALPNDCSTVRRKRVVDFLHGLEK